MTAVAGKCWECTKDRHGQCTGRDDPPPVGTGGTCRCPQHPSALVAFTFGAEPIRDGQPVGTSQPVAQCPNCASDRRDFRYVMPIPGTDSGHRGDPVGDYCDNPWHTPTTTTEPT